MRGTELVVAVSVGLLPAIAFVGCVPPQGPTAMVSKSGKQTPMRPSEVRVVAAVEAAAAGWTGRPVSRTFGAGRDGTELVSTLLAEAERGGAVAVSDITITLAASTEDGPAECRTQILPERVSETRLTPATHRLVPVQRMVSRMVTEPQYRCHMESRPETRSVTTYELRCRSVSRPVTRTRTTYSHQYDSRTRSSRSVPRTESYTTYESRQECHSEPVHRMKTETVMKNVCRHETTTRTVTRYEHHWQSQYVPPRLETLTHHRLREGTPDCYALNPPAAAAAPAAPEANADAGTGASTSVDAGAGAGVAPQPPAPANRIEAVFYFPRTS